MPQQPPTTFRIEDLKARLKLEPKSRLFYPLAEELRKINRLDEAEKVLREGLAKHGSYTSAWISLGRVLHEQKKHQEAVDALNRAFTLDQGNVVAARLLADAYLAMGEKVEAIKKYKLVRALLPADESVEAAITRLEVELHRPAVVEAPAVEPVTLAEPIAREEEIPRHPVTAEPVTASEARTDTEPFRASEPAVPLTPTMSADGTVQAVDVDAAMSGGTFTAAADRYAEEIVPPRAEVVGEREVEEEERRDFPLQEETESAGTPPFATSTIADLYARQGHHEEAREIYSKVQSDQDQAPPDLGPDSPAAGQRDKVARLENWLSRVTRK